MKTMMSSSDEHDAYAHTKTEQMTSDLRPDLQNGLKKERDLIPRICWASYASTIEDCDEHWYG